MAASVTTTKTLLCLFIVLLFSAVIPPRTEAAVGCSQVFGNLAGCVPYVTNRGALGRCCGGVRKLYSIARTTADRRSVCNCIKTLARSYRTINYGKAAGLPGQCGVRVPYRISPNTDCSRVR